MEDPTPKKLKCVFVKSSRCNEEDTQLHRMLKVLLCFPFMKREQLKNAAFLTL